MSTKRVVIQGNEQLEAILREGSGQAGVVICHPHPLYGGSMYNNVVDAIDAGYSARGYTTLRFNFRGVGGSSGSYGEGEGEMEDLIAAYQYLKGACRPGAHLVLAGYSFGAWIAARTHHLLTGLSSIFLVALPIALYGTGRLSSFVGTLYLVAGSYDDIAPARDIREFYERLPGGNRHLKVIAASHFFESKEGEIASYIEENVADYPRGGSQ